MNIVELPYNGYLITTDKSKLQPEAIHQWLSTEAYWCKGIPFETVKTAFDNSYCIGVLKNGQQVGYARLITDYAVFAYLADVYVLPEHGGQGLAKQMMKILMDLDWVKGLRGLKLATRDAHTLYTQFGFKPLAHPDRMMEKSNHGVYGDMKNDF